MVRPIDPRSETGTQLSEFLINWFIYSKQKLIYFFSSNFKNYYFFSDSTVYFSGLPDCPYVISTYKHVNQNSGLEFSYCFLFRKFTKIIVFHLSEGKRKVKCVHRTVAPMCNGLLLPDLFQTCLELFKWAPLPLPLQSNSNFISPEDLNYLMSESKQIDVNEKGKTHGQYWRLVVQ